MDKSLNKSLSVCGSFKHSTYYIIPKYNSGMIYLFRFFPDTHTFPSLKKIIQGINSARNMKVENGSSVFKHQNSLFCSLRIPKKD